MADSKITALTSIGTITDPAVDPLVIVDVSDTSMAPTGTTKKVTLNQLLGASGTATLASATITGAANFNGGALAAYLNGNLMFGSSGNIVNFFAQANGFAFKENTGANNLLTISNAGVFGFLDGAGSTRMTLNSTGLGVGYAPSGSADKIGSAATLGVVATGATADLNFRNSSLTAIQRIRYTDGTGVLTIGSATGTAYPVEIGGNTTTRAMTLDASGRLLVGKTSGVNNIETVGAGIDGRGSVTGVSTVATTIYTIKQSATAAMCVVFGDDGSNGFCDIVLFLATVAPKVVSSQTLYGSPAARTYTASTTNLQLALASGTLTIRTAALSTLNA